MTKERVYCGVCEKRLPPDKFYASSLAAGESRCKTCQYQENKRRRKNNPCERMRRALQQAERRRTKKPAAMLPVSKIKEIMRRSLQVSAISGSDEDLVIAPFFPNMPIYENTWNAVVITRKEFRGLSRTNCKKRFGAFPSELYAKMRKLYNEQRGDNDW